jgi:hypothetical protein
MNFNGSSARARQSISGPVWRHKDFVDSVLSPARWHTYSLVMQASLPFYRRLTMNITKRTRSAVLSAFLALPLAAGTVVGQQAAAPKHHSKLKGALVGAAAGHVLGGHAKAGAVVGALVQHHRNKTVKKG